MSEGAAASCPTDADPVKRLEGRTGIERRRRVSIIGAPGAIEDPGDPAADGARDAVGEQASVVVDRGEL